MKPRLSSLLTVLLVGVLLYGIFVLYTGLSDIANSMQHFHWWTFAAALGLACTNYALRILKWQYYLKLLGVTGIHLADSALIFLSGFVLTITPGKLGEVFKSAVMAETHGVPVERTAPIIVAERLTDVLAVVALILIGSASFDGGLSWALAGSGSVGVGLLLIFWDAPVNALLAWMRSSWAARFVPKLQTAYLQLRKLSSPRALLLPTLLSVIGWGCEGLALFVLLVGFEQSVGLWQACFFYATATLAGALVPVPGGLGVIEMLIQQQLVRLGGVSVAAATSSMLLIRLATLWWAVLVGFAALGLLKLRFPGLFAKRTLTM